MGKSFKSSKIVQLFLDECKEYLDNLDQDLVKLEQGDSDEEVMKRISRTLHTIKGSSAMVEFMDISDLAHRMEDVLDELRKKLPDVDDDLLDRIFQDTDKIKNLVSQIENGTYGQGETAENSGDDSGAKKDEKKKAAPPFPKENQEKKAPPPEKDETSAEAPPAKKKATAENAKQEEKDKSAEKDDSEEESSPKQGLPEPPPVGRTSLFEVAGEELRPFLERCMSTFSEIENKYVLADEKAQDKSFYDKIFDSIDYLYRSLVCFGEPTVNEILDRLLVFQKPMAEGLIKPGSELIDTIFRGASFCKAIIEARMAGIDDKNLPDATPLIKTIHKLTAPVRDQKDYLPLDSAEDIFEHFEVRKDLRKFFTTYEKRSCTAAHIDSKNVYQIHMNYGLEDLGDLASMADFFKPLSDSGRFLSAFVIARGKNKTTEYYDFYLIYSTKLNSQDLNKKYSFLSRVGGIEIENIQLEHADAGDDSGEDSSVADTPAKGSPSRGRSAKAAQKKPAARTTVRVDTDKLDVLVNLIAELVINHNKLEQETKRMKQAINQIGDVIDSLKLSRKSTGLAERNISLDDMLKPFHAIQSDALELGDRRLDRNLLDHMKELREARENLIQLFDMGLEKETLTEELFSKLSGMKTDFKSLYQEFQEDALNIGRMIEELQEETMKLRMLPISGVFSKFPRRVRDIAKSLGKRVDFLIEGEDTELDKTLIEEIEDPLLHIIRNAVDHGIETREERRRIGKSDRGRITARAFHEGNSVVIEVEDDGKGMDPEELKRKCVKKNLITKEEAEQKAERDAYNLGVGMDVVKNNITKLKGTVNVNSKLGEGTVFKLKLPLTLAIIQAMIVKCNGHKFVIPMDPIESSEQVSRYDVHYVEGKEVYRFQEMIIPLIHMRDIYNLEEPAEKKSGSFPVVILAQVEKKIGLIVDEVVEKQQVVIKSLGDFLGDVKHISGATIFGDGSIAMILDVAGIIQSVPYISKRADQSGTAYEGRKERLVLLVDDSLSGRIAQREMLEHIGFVVDVASSGMEALGKLAERNFDVIVTDINMPGMNGYEFTQKVRSIPDTSRLPIIMVTSDIKGADRNRAFEVGINEFLTKPFTEEDLKAAIDRHIHVF